MPELDKGSKLARMPELDERSKLARTSELNKGRELARTSELDKGGELAEMPELLWVFTFAAVVWVAPLPPQLPATTLGIIASIDLEGSTGVPP